MDNLVKKLRELRELETEAIITIKQAQSNLEDTAEWTSLQKAKKSVDLIRTDLGEADLAVRNKAIEFYQANNENKKPHPKVNIIIRTLLDYDPSLAIEWASRHCQEMLQLDRTKFERYFKATQPILRPDHLPFVTVKEEPAVRIASEL